MPPSTIIAGIFAEIGVVEEINQLLGRYPKEIVSAGYVVKAMTNLTAERRWILRFSG